MIVYVAAVVAGVGVVGSVIVTCVVSVTCVMCVVSYGYVCVGAVVPFCFGIDSAIVAIWCVYCCC